MIIAIDAILAIMFIAIGYVYVCCYCNNINVKEINGQVIRLTKNKTIYLMGTLIIAASVVYVFETVYTLSIIQNIKLLCLILIMFPIAAIDMRYQKIPNKVIIVAFIIRCIIYIPEFVVSASYGFAVLKDNMIGALIIGGFFLVLLLVFKNSIGMGDIKLFAIIGLYQGLWGAINSVFFSLVVSFVVSIFLLATRKKGRKDTISFGPSILIGTVIAICLAGM